MVRRRTGDGAAGAAPSAPPAEACREAALRLLAVRERSAAELRGRLRQRGFESDTIESVLDRLRDAGLQDDVRFAEQFAAEAVRSRGMAARRIRLELRSRGIDSELAAAAAASRPEDEEERAYLLARRRRSALGSLPPDVRARRLEGMLGRRGYDPETARRVARDVAGVSDLPDHPDPGGSDPEDVSLTPSGTRPYDSPARRKLSTTRVSNIDQGPSEDGTRS